MLADKLVKSGTWKKLSKYENWLVCFSSSSKLISLHFEIYQFEVNPLKFEKCFLFIPFESYQFYNHVYPLSYLARTDPRDVARVESKTLICTPEQRDAIPTPAPGVEGTLGKWQDPDSMMESLNERFNGCMEG